METMQQDEAPDSKVPASSDMHRLFIQAEKEMELGHYDVAKKNYVEIIGIEPNNVEALEKLAGIHLDMLNIETAKNMLHYCIELNPLEGYTKYFSLAGLSEDKEAITLLNKGIKMAKTRLDKKIIYETEQDTLLRDLSGAYCNLAKIYLADSSASLLTHRGMCLKAIEHDPLNAEAYVWQATSLIARGFPNRARTAIEKCVNLWLPVRDLGFDEPRFLVEAPSYESRIQLAKLLIELEMFKTADRVLHGLLTDCNSVIDVWYLLGYSHFSQGGLGYKNAHYFFTRGRRLIAKGGTADSDVLTKLNGYLDELDLVFSDLRETTYSDNDEDMEMKIE